MDDSLTRAAAERPGKRLGKLLAKRAKARPQVSGFTVPVLAFVPHVDSPTNMWIDAAGNLFWRRWDGVTVSAAIRTGYAAGAAAIPNEEEVESGQEVLTLWKGTALLSVEGTTVTNREILQVSCWCPTHGVEKYLETAGTISGPDTLSEQGDTIFPYGYTEGHGNRLIFVDVLSGLSPHTVDIRQVTIKARNAGTFTNGPVQLHWGFWNGGSATLPTQAGLETYRDVFVDTWPAEGFGGDLEGDHIAPEFIGQSFAAPDPALDDDDVQYQDGLVIHQPDTDPAASGLLDMETLQITIDYTSSWTP